MRIFTLAVITAFMHISAAKAAETPVEQSETLIKRYVEEFINNGNEDVLADVLAPDFVRYGPGILVLHGRDELVAYLKRSKIQYPDLRVTIDDVQADHDTAWVRARFAATRTETAQSSPIGRRIEGPATSFFRFADGRISPHHLNFDTLAVHGPPGGQFLGAAPDAQAGDQHGNHRSRSLFEATSLSIRDPVVRVVASSAMRFPVAGTRAASVQA